MPYITSNSGKIYYEEAGSGHPIIFVHEYSADYRTWEAQIRHLSRRYRCITYNSIGYEPSSISADPVDYDWQGQRRNLLALIDGLEIERAHLVGLSQGAYTVLQFALEYPERASAVAFTSGGAGSRPVGEPSPARDVVSRSEDLRLRGMVAMGAEMARGPSRVQLYAKDTRGWKEFRKYLQEHSTEGAYLTMRHFQGERPSLFSFEDRLRALPTPVLLIVGDEDDPLVPVNLFLKQTIPRVGMWMLPMTGHGVNLEEPALYNAALQDFFDQVERGLWKTRAERSIIPPDA